MSGLAELLERVCVRAEAQTANLPACVSDQELAEAERILGFALPTEVRRLYGEVANGGFGPEYFLFPLMGEGSTAVTEYGTLRESPSEFWPRGVLPILDWGCGMYGAVDCLRPDAPVLLFDPNADTGDAADAWFQDSPSLTQWLVSWLDGTGWWEEDVMSAEDGAEPRPWTGAAQRVLAG